MIKQVILNHYTSQAQIAVANLHLLLENPRSIPEHSDFIAECDKWISAAAEAYDKLHTAENIIPNEPLAQ